MAGREKKYTPKSLEKAVGNYFMSISRTQPVTEPVWTGELDERGHKVYELQPVMNDLGEIMTHREYAIPPTVSGLCQYLGIHRATWARYCDPEQYPEFCDTTTRARGCLRAYLEEQLLIRKDVRGIIFDLQNNHGYAEKKEIELGRETQKVLGGKIAPEEREELLSLLQAEMRNDAEPGTDGAGD